MFWKELSGVDWGQCYRKAIYDQKFYTFYSAKKIGDRCFLVSDRRISYLSSVLQENPIRYYTYVDMDKLGELYECKLKVQYKGNFYDVLHIHDKEIELCSRLYHKDDDYKLGFVQEIQTVNGVFCIKWIKKEEIEDFKIERRSIFDTCLSTSDAKVKKVEDYRNYKERYTIYKRYNNSSDKNVENVHLSYHYISDSYFKNANKSMCNIRISNMNSEFGKEIFFRSDENKLNKLSVKDLKQVINYIVQTGMDPDDIKKVKTKEVSRIQSAISEKRTCGGEYEVYAYLGKEYMPGQGNIDVVWKFLCKNLENGKFYIVEEMKTWGYSNPDMTELKNDILTQNVVYFYDRFVPTNEVQKRAISTANSPILVSLVKDGLFDLEKDTFLYKPEDDKLNQSDIEEDGNDLNDKIVETFIDESVLYIDRECLVQLSTAEEKLVVHLDGERLVSGEYELDENSHVMEFFGNRLYKKVIIQPSVFSRSIKL